MPTLVIDDVPASIYERIQHLAKARQRTPSDTVLEVLGRVKGVRLNFRKRNLVLQRLCA